MHTMAHSALTALQHIGGDNNTTLCVYLYLKDSRKIYIYHDDLVADILENDEQVSVHVTLWQYARLVPV